MSVEEPCYQVMFSIRERGKVIPYPAIDHGTSVNYGFKVLKGKPEEEIALICEVQDNKYLENALISINNIATPFFSVGCEKAYNTDESGNYVKGFLEISFNNIDLVQDAHNYFQLFFDFNQFICMKKFNQPIYYLWEIEPSFFKEAQVNGFSLVIWITSGYSKDMEKTKELWGDGILFLTDYFKTVPAIPGPNIY